MLRGLEFSSVGLGLCAGVVLVGCLAFLSRPAVAQDVAILYSDGPDTHITTLVQQIQATTVTFDSIDTIDVGAATPNAAALAAYDGVLVYSVGAFDDPQALGNALADYVDDGGGVVTGMQTHYLLGALLSGRFVNQGYHAFELSWFDQQAFFLAMGTVHEPTHPAIENVSSLTMTVHPTTNRVEYLGVMLHEDSLKIASFDDTNATPLLAERLGVDGRVLALNMPIPSNQTLPGSWDASSDGATLIAEALHYVTLPGVPLLLRNKVDLMVPRGESETITTDHLWATDLYHSESDVEYRVTGTPDHGLLLRDTTSVLNIDDTFTQQDIDDGRISYEHDDSGYDPDYFFFTVSTPNDSLAAMFTFNVVGPNQPPQLTLPGPQVVDGNVQSLLFYVNEGNGISVDDPDAGQGEMRLELQIDRGRINVLFPGSLTVIGGNPSQEIELRGTLEQLQDALGAGVRVDRPAASWFGDVYFTLLIDDQGNTGSGGALTDSGTITITWEEPYFSGGGGGGACGNNTTSTGMAWPLSLLAALLLVARGREWVVGSG